MTETESGLDVLLAEARPNPAAIGTFAAQAGALGVARLSAGDRLFVSALGCRSSLPDPWALIDEFEPALGELELAYAPGGDSAPV